MAEYDIDPDDPMPDTITVTVRRLDAQALVMGGLDYAVAVGEGKLPPGASPMRLRRALSAALTKTQGPSDER